MSNARSRRSSGFTLLLLGGIVLALAIAVGYQAINYTTPRSETDRCATEADTLQQQLHALCAEQETYASATKRLGPRKAAPTWSEQMPAMVKQLSEIVERQHSRLATLHPVPMVTRGPVARFPLRISFRSDLAGAAKILADLERAEPLLEVERLTVRSNLEMEQTLQVDMTVVSFAVLDADAPRDPNVEDQVAHAQ
jgi:hypothetical protein